MKLRSLSRTSRRGYSLPEVVTAAFLVMVVTTSVASILAIAGRMEQAVNLQSDTSRGATEAMNRVVLDVREAKEVEIITSSRFRIYRPLVSSDGRYNRYQTNYTNYVEYAQSTVNGTPSATGTYIWRKTNATTGRAISANLKLLQATTVAANSVRITIDLEKRSANRVGATNLTERVLYLRNN
jgi:hypothetical protein